VPWAGWLTAPTLRGSPSGSVSLARTATVTGVSSGWWRRRLRPSGDS
jgi:hypothetical protein